MGERKARVAFGVVCLVCLLVPTLYVLRKNARSTVSPPAAAPGAIPAPPVDDAIVVEPAPPAAATPPGEPGRPTPGAPASGPSAGNPVRFLYRNTALGPDYGALAVRSATGAVAYRRALPCERVHFAGGIGVCLTADRGFLTTYAALVFDEAFEVRHRIDLAGGGSRVRVAPDGKRAAITVFVSGHSYADASFSTATTLIDTGTGATMANLEEFTTIRDASPWKEQDFNFWGVTFARDGNAFYATLSTGGRTFLVRGDVQQRRMEVVREGVECPSLSPDGSRIAFKKVVDRPYRHWIIAVLDLATMQERVLTESRNVDDQVDWLDDDRVLYGLPESEMASSAVVNTWVLDRRGSGEPRLLLRDAASTVIVR